jgi:2-dehydropantoate 2-reductase
MRYVIYGAGAVGGTIGCHLFEGGADVALIARGAHHDAIASRGLELRAPGRTVVLPIPVVDHPGDLDLGPDDVVVLAMKSQHTAGALDALYGATSPPRPAVVCAQNGVDNERVALRRFPDVYGMAVMLPAAHLEPGVVEAYGHPFGGVLDVGRYPEGMDERAKATAADLEAAAFRAAAQPQIMRFKYSKLLLNLGNALEAACGAGADWGHLWTRACDEALACYAAAGIDRSSDEEDRERRDGMGLRPIDGQRRAGGSTWQSLIRNADSVEADYLNGEIVLLGRLHGVPTPVNALLQGVANRMARSGLHPGAFSVEDLERELASTQAE